MAEMNKDTLEVTFDTSTEADENIPNICDVTVLEVEGVYTTVVTDYSNKCVKSFFAGNNNTSYSRLQLNDSPFGITQLGDNKIMVSIPDIHQIVTIAVTPELVHEAHINTRKKYNSLAVMSSSRLAAGGANRVDILNMQGEVLKSVPARRKKRKPLFSCPWYMCVNNMGHLLVSDWDKGTVTCLTPEGHVVWTHSGTREERLSSPKGIITMDDGRILVADRSSQKVLQLSGSGEFVRDVVTLQDYYPYPWGICVDKQGSLIACKFSCRYLSKIVFT